ncbi:MAG: hypothetical protein K2N07_02450, partial [Desulfovibrio sp.]|nr:hypothetical protein [Desulfovibrio sp.]
MSDRPDIRLEVAGQLWGGWTSIEIRRGLEQCAGTFSLDLTDRWPGQESRRSMLQPLRRRKLRMETATSYFDSQPTEPLSLSVSTQSLLTASAKTGSPCRVLID